MSNLIFKIPKHPAIAYAPYPEGRSLPSFDGHPHEAGSLFFFRPPAEIGKVMYAYTSMHENTKLVTDTTKNYINAIGASSGLALGYYIGWWSDIHLFGYIGYMVIFMLIGMWVAGAIVGGFDLRHCMYLGENGLSMAQLKGGVNGISGGTLVFNANLITQSFSVEQSEGVVSEHLFRISWNAEKLKYNLFNPSFEDQLGHTYIEGEGHDIEYAIFLKTETHWLNFLYNEAVLPAFEREGLYLYHSGITLFKDHFTFFHRNAKIKVDKTNLHALYTKTIKRQLGTGTLYTPYLVLNEGGEEIPIAPLNAVMGDFSSYDCKLILWHVKYLGLTLPMTD